MVRYFNTLNQASMSERSPHVSRLPSHSRKLSGQSYQSPRSARTTGWPRQYVRTSASPPILTADKGYDWELLRRKLRFEDVKTVIKHHEFGWHGVANNVLLDDTTYYQRSNIKSTFCASAQIRRDRSRENLIRTLPRTRSQVCRQRRRTSSRRL